jgi:hypothetical protein
LPNHGGAVGAFGELFHLLRSEWIVSVPGAGRLFQKIEKNRYPTPIFHELEKISRPLLVFYSNFNMLPMNLQKWQPHGSYR